MRHFNGTRTVLALALLALLACGAHAASIVIVNSDGAGEGFNDPTVVAPIGGNPGTTLGQQRLNVFQHAAGIWGGLLPSAVTIRVQARFNPQTCMPTTAVLGSAGPIEVASNFPNAPVANTYYHVALANKLATVDLAGSDDIQATFNSNIDNNDPMCLGGTTDWYYGFDGNEGLDIELLPVVLHELGHGLGFSTLVNLSTGAEFLGDQDIYETFIRDNTLGLTWNQMTNGQRATSAVNDGNVVWTGPHAKIVAPGLLGDKPIMQVHTPPAIAGTLDLGTAAFGPQLDGTGPTGDVVLVDDGVGTTSDACEAIVNGAQIAGNIVLIDRGTCTFAAKAQAAEAAGAIAVIIANNIPGNTPPGLGGSGAVNIPTVSITQAAGNSIKAQLVNGVNVTLTLDPDFLAGADSENRVKLYAPPALSSGSSISHWDVSATPSLLMEPSLTATLSDEVDLTLYHFEDIGWVDLATSAPDGTVRARLDANVPNPFNPSTQIAFSLSRGGAARLEVYDVAGRLVRRLVHGTLPAGEHVVKWDGQDDHARPAASGVYVYRLVAPGTELSRRMALVR